MSAGDTGTESIIWGKPEDGLMLGVAAEGAFAHLYLRNVGNAPLIVLSHVLASGIHLDWFWLNLHDAAGKVRRLRLLDERDESDVIKVRLEPGERLQHRVAVQGWAMRRFNRSQPLAPGTYQLDAVYEVVSREGCWNGHLEAGPVALTISTSEASPDSPDSGKAD